MDDTAIAVFTNRGRDRLLAEGGSQAWALDQARAAMCNYLVCIQNRHADGWGQPTHQHRHAFLVAKVAGVVPSKEAPGRFMILFTEYASVDIPIKEKWRNPVRYTDLASLGIDSAKLKFSRVRLRLLRASAPEKLPEPEDKSAAKEGLDIASAKKALSAFYGVPTGAIEIVIRG